MIYTDVFEFTFRFNLTN